LVRAEQVLERGLASTVSCELWRFFTAFKRDALIGSAPGGDTAAPALATSPTAEAYDATEAAFGRALDEVGGSIDALPLWQAFIDFFNGRLEAATTQYDQGSLQNKLRGVYQRAIKQPMDGVPTVWTAYEAFERSLVSEGNRILAERILKDKEPGAKNIIELARERAKLYEGISLTLLACPAAARGSSMAATQLRQLRKWRDVVKWEKEQGATQSAPEIRIRVRHTYKQGLCCLRFFPELWYEFAMEELAARDTEAALQVLATACSVLAPKVTAGTADGAKGTSNAEGASASSSSSSKDKSRTGNDDTSDGSLLLSFARASLLERLARPKEATAIYKELTDKAPCPLVHIQYMRFARRALKNGVKAARSVFAKARKRKDASCSWRVFVCAALMEFYANKNPEVAGKVFELGLKRFPDSVPFISQYVRFLSGLNDQEAPLRVLFQRIVGSALNDDAPDKIKPIWAQYLAFENSMAVDGGDIGASEMLEKRFRDKYADLGAECGGAPSGLALQAYRYSFLDLEPDLPADRAYLEREGYARHGMMSGPLTFMDAGLGGTGGGGRGGGASTQGSSAASSSQDRSRSPMVGTKNQRNSRSRSRSTTGGRSSSNRNNSNKSNSNNNNAQPSGPMVIYPSFLAPLLAELPLDDQNVYWPTKEEDVKDTIRKFQVLPLPPPPPAEDVESSNSEKGSSGKRKRDESGDNSVDSGNVDKDEEVSVKGKGKKRAAGNDIYLRRKRDRVR
jgi:cleavage stimulation factor subunit 3